MAHSNGFDLMQSFTSLPGRRSAPVDPLPRPDADALAHSRCLTDAIRGEMEGHGGALAFDRFMELALYAPGLGYYMAGSRKLGAEGDFVTAPEVSPLFGQCLARQCAQVLDGLQGGDILEFGAGSGALARVILEELAHLQRLPRRYLILEPSPELQQRQQRLIEGLTPELAARVQWLDRLPQRLRGVAIANEVLDAMAVHRFVMRDGVVRELSVRWNGSGFEEFAASPESTGLAAAVHGLMEGGVQLCDGYLSELNLRAGPWITALGRMFEAGVAMLIGYGYPRSEYYLPERTMGTLMCHYRHRAHPDPYRFVGLQDITAYVDFSAVAEAGAAAGMSLAGYTTQANFLLACGLEELLADSDPADVEAHMQRVQGAKRLILPSEMGERFQVMALARDFAAPLLGFSLRDLRGRL
jgi:SAM-dependent MidA family methyltransferase